METTIFASNTACGLLNRTNNNTECVSHHIMKLDKTKTKLACEKCGYSFEILTLK